MRQVRCPGRRHFKHQLSCGSLNVYVTEEPLARRRDVRREAEVTPPLSPPKFEHFDFWAPLLRAGEHYLHVTVRRDRRRGGRGAEDEVCTAVRAALAEVEATPGRAECIARRGQELARALSMERVLGYMAGVVRGAAAAETPELARKLVEPYGEERVLTKRNFLRHVSRSTLPWIEKLFLPWHGVNATARTRERETWSFS